MNKILLVSLSAAILSLRLSGEAQAAYTERDVDRMEDMISAGNWVDLRTYLLSNPSLMSGSDSFAESLRRFLEETDSLYTALIFESSMFPDPSLATPTAPPPVAVARRSPVPTDSNGRGFGGRPNANANANATSSNSNSSANSGSRPGPAGPAAVAANSIY